AARADADPPDAAVHDRPDRLKVRFEPPRADVVRVALLPAYDRRLPTDLAVLGHQSFWGASPRQTPSAIRSRGPLPPRSAHAPHSLPLVRAANVQVYRAIRGRSIAARRRPASRQLPLQRAE